MKAPTKLLLTLTAAAALLFAHPAKANLITNGGFETGDFTGWTTSGVTAVTGTSNGIAPHSGNFQANLGGGAGVTSGSITQTLATMAGQSYTIDLWYANPGGGVENAFTVIWGGVQIFQNTNDNPPYTELTFTETASSTSTALELVGIVGVSHDAAWLVDDVTVTPVGVPDGGSTVSLLGFALLGLVGLRRKLSC